MLVEDGKITKKRGHEEPPPGQAGRDVGAALQPGLARDLRLLTRFARSVVGRCACGYQVEYLDGAGFRSSEVAFSEAKTRRKEQSQGERVASDALLDRWLHFMLLRRAAVAGKKGTICSQNLRRRDTPLVSSAAASAGYVRTY